jgi:linoleoyl-CoA desaturase
MVSQKIKFQNRDQASFFGVLRQNIDQYFQTNNIEKTGGSKIMVKAIVMLSMYFIPYIIVLTAGLPNYLNLILCFVMGLGVAGTGMSVMHDAIHGSFSSNKLVNDIFGASLYFLGGNVQNWDIQHNKLHHTYTNIHEVDEDITGKFLLRLSFQDKMKSVHRFQHIYAFFLYGLMTISFLWKDFKEIGVYKEMSKLGFVKAFTGKELLRLYISKIAYVLFIMVLPLTVLDISFGQWFLGFMVMHLTAGIILSTIFQLAHVVEDAHHPNPDDKGIVDSAWAVHQLLTTSNFFGKNRLLSWYIGGLDFQIEHHLFPTISHIHYRKIAPIVEKTAKEFGINYNSKGSFTNALKSHIKMLKDLGTKQDFALSNQTLSL